MAGSPTLLLVCVAGIYVCYLAYGLLQESLYKKQEDGTKFQATAFVLLVQCIGNALVALLGMWLGAHVGLDRAGPVTKGDDHKAPTPLLQVLQHRDAMTTSAVYVFAMYTSNEALKYVSYPAQALAKSSKMIPVMIGRIVILGNRYEWYKYVFVGMVTLGVTLFQFADGGSKHKSSKHSSSADEGGEMWGVLLLLGSLALDGMSGPEQEKLDRVHKLTNSQQMLVSNVWAVVYMAMVALLLGQLDTSFVYLASHPNLVTTLILFALTSAFGQVFIFLTIKSFDSLILSTITTTRKFFTIVASVLVNGHVLGMGQWLAVGLVFVGLAADQVVDQAGKRGHKHAVGHTGGAGSGGHSAHGSLPTQAAKVKDSEER